MLKGIPSCISPELLKILAEMGHGDEIVLADAHFPGHSLANRPIRADGVPTALMLDAILRLVDLDTYETPIHMMAPVAGDQLDESVEQGYMAVVGMHSPNPPKPVRLAREKFYERAGLAYAVVMTGETRKYGNIIIKKGVTAA
jgi:L-fucose mutarotase